MKKVILIIMLLIMTQTVYAALPRFLPTVQIGSFDKLANTDQTDKNWTFANVTASNFLGDSSLIKVGNLSLIFLERNSSLWNRTGNFVYLRNTQDFVGINTTKPSHKLTVSGDVLFNLSGADHFEIHADAVTDDAFFIELEPSVDGISAIHAEIEIDSIPGTKFITLDYGANGLADEEFATGMLLNFDVSGSTGGSIDAILVNQVGEGDNTAEVHALSVEHGVKVIFQESGESLFADVYILNTSTTSNNITGNVSTKSGTPPFDIEMFSSNGDILMIGHSSQFSDIEVLLATSASNPGIKPVFEHSIAGGWKTFTPTDGTRGFRDSGVIRYELADVGLDWVQSTENNQTKFWFKIERTQGGGGLNPPVESLLEVITTEVFEWDEEGDVFIDNLNLSGDIRYKGDNLTIRGSTGQIEIFGTPDSDASFSAFAVFSDTNADPELRVHSRGVGRSVHSLMSLKVSQNLGHLCSVETNVVDCDGSATGADLVVNDDIWSGGSAFFGNATFNISDTGNLVTSGNITAVNTTTNILLVKEPPVVCPTGTFMTYTNLTTSICVAEETSSVRLNTSGKVGFLNFSGSINITGILNASRTGGKLDCSLIDGGTDGDFCVDTSGGAGAASSNFQITNVSNKTAPISMINADFGDYSCDGAGSCTLDANVCDSAEIATNSVKDDEVDYSVVTLTDFTNDVPFTLVADAFTIENQSIRLNDSGKVGNLNFTGNINITGTLNASKLDGSLDCSNIVGGAGADSDFCADATGSGGGTGVIEFSSGDNDMTGDGQFFGVSKGGSATEAEVRINWPFSITVTGIHCNQGLAGNADRASFTLSDDGSPTAVTCTTDAGVATCSQTGQTVSVAGGSLLGIDYEEIATATAGHANCMVTYTED